MPFRKIPTYVMVAALLTISVGSSAQQRTFYGKVTDAISREPLPFVNIYIKGTSSGTTTDLDGNYSFTSYSQGDSIIASNIGYEPNMKPVRKLVEQEVNFVLERANINLEEIVIRPTENPAHILLRKVIANKEKNSNQKLESYSYEAYNKVEMDLYDWNPKFQDRKVMRPFQFVFESIDSTSEETPFLPIFLSETISDYYFQSDPPDEREVIKASRQSGFKNESFSQLMGSLYQEVSVYDNWPALFAKNFASPINDHGLNYYKYYLVDSAYIDQTWCYKINFMPKNKGSFTFNGDMWIADSSFAVKQISMEAANHVNVNFVDKISIYQEFDNIADSLWMLSKDKIVIRFKVINKALGFIGRKTAMFKDFVLDDPEILVQVEERADIEVDKKAFEKDNEYWQRHRHENLTNQESDIYELVDSIKNTNAFNNWMDIARMVIRGYYPVGPVEFGRILALYSSNDVEGHRFQFGMRTTSEMTEHFRIGGYAAYGLKDKRWKYGASLEIFLKTSPRHVIEIEYLSDLDLRPDSKADFGQDNVLTGFLRRNVPQKFNFLKRARVSYEKEWPIGLSSKLTLQHREITPQEPLVLKYVKPNEGVNGNDTITNVTSAEATIRLRFAYREKFLANGFSRVSLGTKYPRLMVFYTVGVNGIHGSDYQYHRLDAVLYDRVPVNPIGTFVYTFMAGKVFGTLPYLLLEIAQGNETYFYNRFAFNLMTEYEFISDTYAALMIRHHFEGFFLNKIPGIRKLKWRTLISAKAVIGNMTNANKKANELNTFTVPFPKPYVEVGFGIENIFKLFEVDALWRLTYRNLPYASKFGIRAGIKFDF